MGGLDRAGIRRPGSCRFVGRQRDREGTGRGRPALRAELHPPHGQSVTAVEEVRQGAARRQGQRPASEARPLRFPPAGSCPLVDRPWEAQPAWWWSWEP